MDWNVICFNGACFTTALYLLEYGASKFINATAALSKRLGVSETLVALLTAGAEWEEVCTTLVPNALSTQV